MTPMKKYLFLGAVRY